MSTEGKLYRAWRLAMTASTPEDEAMAALLGLRRIVQASNLDPLALLRDIVNDAATSPGERDFQLGMQYLFHPFTKEVMREPAIKRAQAAEAEDKRRDEEERIAQEEERQRALPLRDGAASTTPLDPLWSQDVVGAAENVYLTRGKHKGKSIMDVYCDDRSYLEWIVNKADGWPEMEKRLISALLHPESKEQLEERRNRAPVDIVERDPVAMDDIDASIPF